MPAPIMCDATIAARCQEEHLVFPRIRVQWPAMAENNRLTFTPVFEVNLRSIFDGDCVHGFCFWFIL